MDRKRSFCTAVAAVLFFAFGSGRLCAEEQVGSTDVQSLPAEVSIANTKRIEFKSAVNGERYSLSIALPFELPSEKGYSVLYVLDGYAYFESAVEAVRAPDRAPGTIVVGIGYPEDPSYTKDILERRGPVAPLFSGLPAFRVAPYLERLYDLTMPMSERALIDLSRQGLPKYRQKDFGGLDSFLRVLETEIKPRVASIAPIDAGNQVLFGHSLGGSAVIREMLHSPSAFRAFIIASPAIFWGNGAVLAEKENFAIAVNTGRASPRIFVSVGSNERPPEFPRNWPMIEEGRSLVAWLKSLHGGAEYAVADYAIFDGFDHSFTPWPALARGVSFAFKARRPMRAPNPGKGNPR